MIRYLELARPPQPLTIPARSASSEWSPARATCPSWTWNRKDSTWPRQSSICRTRARCRSPGSKVRHGGICRRPCQAAPGTSVISSAMADFDASEQEGQVALADDQGKANLLSATQLGRLLASHAAMRLVVLNSCDGQGPRNRPLLRRSGAVLTRRGIPAVVSMQYVITDRAALEFSRRTFYHRGRRGYAGGCGHHPGTHRDEHDDA